MCKLPYFHPSVIVSCSSFSGVTIRPHHLLGVDRETFSRQLPLALATWEQEGKRGIWIKVPTEQAELIPVATNVSFHCIKDLL